MPLHLNKPNERIKCPSRMAIAVRFPIADSLLSNRAQNSHNSGIFRFDIFGKLFVQGYVDFCKFLPLRPIAR